MSVAEPSLVRRSPTGACQCSRALARTSNPRSSRLATSTPCSTWSSPASSMSSCSWQLPSQPPSTHKRSPQAVGLARAPPNWVLQGLPAPGSRARAARVAGTSISMTVSSAPTSLLGDGVAEAVGAFDRPAAGWPAGLRPAAGWCPGRFKPRSATPDRNHSVALLVSLPGASGRRSAISSSAPLAQGPLPHRRRDDPSRR